MDFLDQASDATGVDLYRFAVLYDPPDFVKTANDQALVGEGDLPPHAYADPASRTFRIHTAAATWLSAAHFYDKRASLEPERAAQIETRLQRAAIYWGIQPHLAELSEKVAKVHDDGVTQLPDDAFAAVFRYDNEQVERHLPLRNGKEVRAAADWLMTYRDEFPIVERRTIARKILAKAASLSVSLDDRAEDMDRVAGLGVCAQSDMRRLLEDRADRVRRQDLEVTAGLRELARSLDALPDSSRIEKVAQVLDDVDRTFHLVKEYGRTVTRPDDVLHAVTEKVAADCYDDLVRTTTGSVYKKSELLRLRVTDLATRMGTDFADAISGDSLYPEIEKLSKVLVTAPRPDAELFDRVASEFGLKPVEKTAATERTGVNMLELCAILG